jgi:hypothetical protein
LGLKKDGEPIQQVLNAGGSRLFRRCEWPGCAYFKIVDSNGETLAYVYGLDNACNAAIAKALTLDEARRIASNIATSMGSCM